MKLNKDNFSFFVRFIFPQNSFIIRSHVMVTLRHKEGFLKTVDALYRLYVKEPKFSVNAFRECCKVH